MVYVPVQPTYQQVKTELDTDPQALGLVAMEAVQDWNGIVNALNLVRAGAPYVLQRRYMSVQEMVESIVFSEWIAAAVTQPMRDGMALLFLTAGPSGLDPQNTNVRAFFTGTFGSATTTRANLNTKLTRQGSRAEILWGDGVMVNADLVETAARL